MVVLNCQMGCNHQALLQCSVVFWLFAVSQGPVKKKFIRKAQQVQSYVSTHHKKTYLLKVRTRRHKSYRNTSHMEAVRLKSYLTVSDEEVVTVYMYKIIL